MSDSIREFQCGDCGWLPAARWEDGRPVCGGCERVLTGGESQRYVDAGGVA